MIRDMGAAMTAQLETLRKEDFQNCFGEWQEQWDTCVRSEGKYFGGIGGNVYFTVIYFLKFEHPPCYLVIPCIYYCSID